MPSTQVTIVMPHDENDIETIVGVFYGPESEKLAEQFIREAAETNTWLMTSPSEFKTVTFPASDRLLPALVQTNRVTRIGEDGGEVASTVNQSTLPIEPATKPTGIYHSVLITRGNPKGQQIPPVEFYKVLSVSTNLVTDDAELRQRASDEHRQLVEATKRHAEWLLIDHPVGSRVPLVELGWPLPSAETTG